MSALPTTEEAEHVTVLSSGSNTLPHGATMTGYPQMQVRERERERERRGQYGGVNQAIDPHRQTRKGRGVSVTP